MTYAASTIPAFTAALMAALKARPGLKNASICDGPPPSAIAEKRAEVIELGDVDGEQEVKWLNRTTQPRAEDMELTVVITVVHATRDKQTQLNERAFAIFDEFNQLFRSDPALSQFYTGPGRINGARVTRVKHTKRTNQDETRREAGLEFGVRWEAKI